MIVTAVALFFSTFSSPLLVGAADAGPVGGRPLQRRPAALRGGRRLARVAVTRRARSITCCRISRRSTSRPRSCTACRCPRRTSLLTLGLRRRLHRHPAARARWRSSGGGTSSDGGDPRRRGVTSFTLVAIALLLAVAVALQVWRDRGLAPYEPATPVMWLQAGPAMQARGARLRRAGRRPLLDPRGRLFRPPAAVGRDGQELRPAVSAARSGDDARSAVHCRLSLRRDLPVGAAAGRAGPAGSGRRAAEARRRADAEPLGVSARHRLRLLLALSRFTKAAASGSIARATLPGAPIWLKSTGRDDAAQRRRPRIGAHAVAAAARARPTSTGFEQQRRAAGCCSSTRWTRSISSTRSSGATKRASGRVPAAAGRSWSHARVLRAVPRRSDRRAVRDRSASTRRIGCRRDSPLWPLPESASAGSAVRRTVA